MRYNIMNTELYKQLDAAINENNDVGEILRSEKNTENIRDVLIIDVIHYNLLLRAICKNKTNSAKSILAYIKSQDLKKEEVYSVLARKLFLDCDCKLEKNKEDAGKIIAFARGEDILKYMLPFFHKGVDVLYHAVIDELSKKCQDGKYVHSNESMLIALEKCVRNSEKMKSVEHKDNICAALLPSVTILFAVLSTGAILKDRYSVSELGDFVLNGCIVACAVFMVGVIGLLCYYKAIDVCNKKNSQDIMKGLQERLYEQNSEGQNATLTTEEQEVEECEPGNIKSLPGSNVLETVGHKAALSNHTLCNPKEAIYSLSV